MSQEEKNYIDTTNPITINPTTILITEAIPLSPNNPLTIYAAIPPTNKAAIPFMSITTGRIEYYRELNK
ncbi:MAG: hypothetical protein Q4Q22_07965 [Methanosphaera sp.]|nr:hypothetical protein [Methanosphaera sp.]